MRYVNVETLDDTWASAVPSEIVTLAGRRSIDLRKTLTHTALWTRPPKSIGIHLADYWACLRYLPAIDDELSLRLRREWSELDPHQKTILSDDFGIGLTTQLLFEELGCIDFADTRYFLEVLKPDIFKVGKRSRRGPSKLPDFVAQVGHSEFVVLECKGSQTSRQALVDAMYKGIAQKRNLVHNTSGIVRHSLVGGAFIPQASTLDAACIILADPPFDQFAQVLDETSPELMSKAIWQVSLAKQLGLAGFPVSANDVCDHSVNSERPLSYEARTEIESRLSARNGDIVVGPPRLS